MTVSGHRDVSKALGGLMGSEPGEAGLNAMEYRTINLLSTEGRNCLLTVSGGPGNMWELAL